MNRAARVLFLFVTAALSVCALPIETQAMRMQWDQRLHVCEDCVLGTVPGTNLTPGEMRFFEGTPRDTWITVHDDDRAYDLHALFFSLVGVTQVEIFRTVDWVVDLPLPGTPLRPMSRATMGIRGAYRKLPRENMLVLRTAQFADALQIPELSFGDVSAGYNFGSGGYGIASGTLFRVNNLIDWTQHVTGDVNRLAGRPVGRKRGLLPSRLVAGTVDGFQWMVTQVFHQVEVVLSRVIDNGIHGIEKSLEYSVNIFYTRPYHEKTVFVRMPVDIYREHEPWMRARRNKVVAGTQDRFLSATYLELTADRRPEIALPPMLDVLGRADEVVLMMRERVFRTAPEELKDYVVPGAWVLNPQ